MSREELKDKMSIKDFFSKIFNKTEDKESQRKKQLKKINRYNDTDRLLALCQEDFSIELYNELNGKKYNTLNCKHVNRWLNCPYSTTPTYKKKSLSDIDKTNNNLYFHYYINNVISRSYIEKECSVSEYITGKNQPIKMKTEIIQTLNFIEKRIEKFKEKHEDFSIKVDYFSKLNNKYKRLKDYRIQDLPIHFYNSADIIISCKDHCELISYSHTGFDNPLNINEFNLYALISKYDNYSPNVLKINDSGEYTFEFVYYKPTIEREYNLKTYINKESCKTKETTYKEVKEWYFKNKHKIINAAKGKNDRKHGDWCEYCDHNCNNIFY